MLTGQTNRMNEGGLLGQKANWATTNLEEKGKLVLLGSAEKGFRAEIKETSFWVA
jgi:hypothetical protein